MVADLRAEFGGADIAGWGVGPVLDKFRKVSRIAVLRGGGLGDLLFALPAVSALVAAYPGATVTLLGTPVHAELLGSTVGPVSDVRVLPIAEGLRPGREELAAVEAFLVSMRREEFDLAVQLHGGGRYSNPFLRLLGARHTVGSRTADAVPLERNLPYVYYQHEPLRGLEVAGLAGAPPVGLEARLRPRERDLSKVKEFLDRLRDRPATPVVAIHPGAMDPRRRWPAENFGKVAATCAAEGCRVVVLGTVDERKLADEVVMRPAQTGSSRWPAHSAWAPWQPCWTAALCCWAMTAAPATWPRPWGLPRWALLGGQPDQCGPAGPKPAPRPSRLGDTVPGVRRGRHPGRVDGPRCPHDKSTAEGVKPDGCLLGCRPFTAMNPLPHGR